MTLYRSPEYHSTQGEYDLIRGTFLRNYFEINFLLFFFFFFFFFFFANYFEINFLLFLFALDAILFSERHHFSILVEGYLRNIPVKLFQNPLTGLGGDVF